MQRPEVRFSYTDEDLERGAHALLEAHDNPLETFPEDERRAAFANAQSDVEAVLEALGGERACETCGGMGKVYQLVWVGGHGISSIGGPDCPGTKPS